MQTYIDELSGCQEGAAPVWLEPEWQDKNYRATVRRFNNGQVEVSTSVVRAMQQWQRADAWGDSAPALPEGLTDQQYVNIKAQKAHYKAWCAMKRAERMQDATPEDIERLEAGLKADNIDRAVRRARQQIRFHCRQLGVDHLLTLTYRENVEDVMRLQRDWKEFVRLVRKAKPNWQFVACRERQDRGALHLHVAIRGRQDIGLLRRCWYQALGGTGKETGEDTPGQIDVRGPSKRFGSKTQDWKVQKLSGYMTKYMGKAFEELDAKGSKRYWHSKGIEPPQVERIWLASSSFIDAIKESHGLCCAAVGRAVTLWASDRYDCIWLAG